MWQGLLIGQSSTDRTNGALVSDRKTVLAGRRYRKRGPVALLARGDDFRRTWETSADAHKASGLLRGLRPEEQALLEMTRGAARNRETHCLLSGLGSAQLAGRVDAHVPVVLLHSHHASPNPPEN